MSYKAVLIICDVDGTLLKATEEKPNPKVFEMIEHVLKSKKVFSVASGRSQNGLNKLFGFNKNFYCICSDGAYITYNGNIVYQNPINSRILLQILPKLKNSDFVLYGKDFAYASSQSAADTIFNAENGKVRTIEEFKISNDAIFKLAMLNNHSYAEHYIKANNLLRQCYHDSVWDEYVNNSADKGTAVAYLQRIHKASFEETAVFGDNLNDIPMLKKAYFSYAVNNAKSEVKMLARYCTKDVENEIINNLL